MFGKKVVLKDRYIFAVRDYDNTVKALKEGKLTFAYDREIYEKMMDSVTLKVNNLKDLGGFIRANKKSKGEVGHYWEGLIEEGYTLVNVEYAQKIPAISHVGNNDIIKFVCAL